MTNRKIGFSSGFTIIEVALVLAIAGLIFLVVFLALPALQNSQKDTAAREDVGRIVSALESCATDNQGVISACSSDELMQYASGGSGKLSQVLSISINTDTNFSSGITTPHITTSNAMIYYGEVCVGSTAVAPGPANSAIVIVKLEAGSYYCQDY